RITPSMAGSASMAARSGTAAMPNSRAKAWRLSSVRLVAATIFSDDDSAAARASTLAQRPSPTMPTLIIRLARLVSRNSSFRRWWGIPLRYSALPGKLRPPPFERGLEAVGGDPAAEVAAHLGLGSVERNEGIDAGFDRRAKARDLGAAVDHPFAPAQRLRRDQGQPLGIFHRLRAQRGRRHDAVHHAELQ